MGDATINRDKMKKVLEWLSENIVQYPEKKRIDILREAEIRYDLSPKECCFLDENFSHSQDNKG